MLSADRVRAPTGFTANTDSVCVSEAPRTPRLLRMFRFNRINVLSVFDESASRRPVSALNVPM